jgi:hypothetical protein
MQPLDYPVIPETQGVIKAWIDGIDFFKKLVSEHLDNKVLLKELNLAFITKEWCDESEKVYPLDFIDELKSNLQEAYDNNALNLPISEEKINQFENSTKERIEETYDKISLISNSSAIEGDSDKWYVNGQKVLESKDAFSENPEVHLMEFDSFLASFLSNRIVDGVSSTFLFKKTKTYSNDSLDTQEKKEGNTIRKFRDKEKIKKINSFIASNKSLISEEDKSVLKGIINNKYNARHIRSEIKFEDIKLKEHLKSFSSIRELNDIYKTDYVVLFNSELTESFNINDGEESEKIIIINCDEENMMLNIINN